MENGLLLSFAQQQQLLLQLQQPISFFIFFPKPKTSHFRFITSHHHLRFSLITTTTRSRKWDSNAETFRSQKFNFDQNDDEDDDEEEEDEESFYGNVKRKRRWWSKTPKIKKSRNLWEEAVESVWILKVFKSFGWFLPVILISFLIATGPKAFLTSLSIPLLLSLLYLALEKVWENMQRGLKHKARLRRKTFSRYANSVEMGKEGENGKGTRKVKMDNQSRVNSSNGPVNEGSQEQDAPSFGGWDYLDDTGSRRGTVGETSESQRMQEGKLSGSRRKSGTPLLVRLLIAVFPLIGFWAKMFW